MTTESLFLQKRSYSDTILIINYQGEPYGAFGTVWLALS